MRELRDDSGGEGDGGPRPPLAQGRSGRLLFALGGAVVGLAIGFTLGFYTAGALFTKLMDRMQGPSSQNHDKQGAKPAAVLPVPSLSGAPATPSHLDFAALLEDDQGRRVPLVASKGKILFVNVWASYCQPCIAELPALETLYSSLEDHGRFAFISITLDSKDVLRDFLDKRKLRFPVYRFAPGSEIKGLGTAVPVTLIVDQDGLLIRQINGAADWADKTFIDDLRERIRRVEATDGVQ